MQSLIRVVPLTVLVFLAACRMAPVYNVQSEGLNAPPNARLAQVTEVIKQAGARLGWAMTSKSPGHITGKLALRNHIAVVDIKYNTKTFSISYADSVNLKYDGTEIHSNYNAWIRNLRNAILVNAASI